jgi:phosphosulfolactate synthase (CoM biosynthesis protein A)
VTERAAKVLSWTDLEVFATGLWTLTQEQGSADEIDELLKTIKSLGYSEAKLGIF